MHLSRGRVSAVSAALLAGAALIPSAANATLLLEPVFNSVAGNGSGENLIPIYFLDLLNGATGEPFLTANEPGEVITYPAGFPADPVLVNTVRIFNNTDFDITGFTLSIVGTAVSRSRSTSPLRLIPTSTRFGATWTATLSSDSRTFFRPSRSRTAAERSVFRTGSFRSAAASLTSISR